MLLICAEKRSRFTSAAPQRYKLTDAQQLKLKQLTVVNLAQNTKVRRIKDGSSNCLPTQLADTWFECGLQTIAYADLIQQLEVSNLRTLEDLLITECFYAGIIKGKLDQQQRCLHVQETIGRDVQPDLFMPIMAGLSNWWGWHRRHRKVRATLVAVVF